MPRLLGTPATAALPAIVSATDGLGVARWSAGLAALSGKVEVPWRVAGGSLTLRLPQLPWSPSTSTPSPPCGSTAAHQRAEARAAGHGWHDYGYGFTRLDGRPR
ncbi:hypothetical protein GCM10023322_08560 [Rugosimonospora acidiphila]|uniref:Uncharacterized protein n=1 Tax=Rugosimonospora acidiphila TaxID=556531 RepID=A0ABP9RJZ3_9ACTN